MSIWNDKGERGRIDPPTREPFDVKTALTRIRLGDWTNMITEFSAALEEIEILRERLATFADVIVSHAAERDAALARLALAEKVVEAVRLEEECLASDNPARYHEHNGLYKLVINALAAYDAATVAKASREG